MNSNPHPPGTLRFSRLTLALIMSAATAIAAAAPEQAMRADTPADSRPALRFVLTEVIFSDSAFLSKAELAGLSKPYLGHQVGLSEIEELVRAVNEMYQAKNISTGLATLSGQTVVDGRVHIDLIEARLGQVKVVSVYTSADYILGQFNLKNDRALDLSQVEQDLSRFNRVHEIQLGAEVKPGDAPGLTDLTLNATEPDKYQVRLFADNENAPSLGKNEVGVNASVNGILGHADVFALMLSKSKGGDNYFANYGLPFGSGGEQFNAAVSKNNTAILSGAYSAINITGVTDKATLGVNAPLLANLEWLVAADFNFAKSKSSNYSAGKLLSRFDVDDYSASIAADRRTAAYQWSDLFQVDYGKAIDSLDKHSDYVLYSGNFNAMLPLYGATYGSVRANGQFTKAENLPPSALFQVGGAASVRGYDTGLVTGRDGYALGLELHNNFAEGWNGFVFVDHGEAANSNAPKTKISGAGFGVSWTWKTVSSTLTYGHAENIVRPEQARNNIEFKIEGRIF
ncbi:hemolysin activation/secretion protein [Oxalobacteraceae bacterium GrIS 2.11]